MSEILSDRQTKILRSHITPMAEPILELDGVAKSFGTTRAVASVSLRFESGRITALAGENGAGKTTAMRIATGELSPDTGTVRMNGHPVRFESPRDSARLGIDMVHQHFMLVSNFSIAENLALADASLPFLAPAATINRRAVDVMDRTGITLDDPLRRIGSLSVGEKSRLELVKALARRPRLLILDEPTSVLTLSETGELFTILRRLARDGMAVVFISHKLAEVFEIADDIVVMRAGEIVLDTTPDSTTASEIAAAMIGQRVTTPVAETGRATEDLHVESRRPALDCAGLTVHTDNGSSTLSGVNLKVHPGAIVSIVGVAGNGQMEIAETLRGLRPWNEGSITIDGGVMTPDRLRSSRTVAHVPADRTRDGVIRELTIAEHFALAGYDRREAWDRANDAIARYRIRATSPRQRVGSLSGGNQQKVILARELSRNPRLIVAAEPTRGLDIESTLFVRARLREAAASGTGVLLITSDLDEAFELSSTIHVIYRGRLSDQLEPGTALEQIGRRMAGLE